MSQLCHLRTPKSQNNSPEPAHFHRLRQKCPTGFGSTTLITTELDVMGLRGLVSKKPQSFTQNIFLFYSK